MTWVLLFAGLALLLGGGEALVNGSVGVARRFRVSPLVIGLTLVGFGTSTPELVASLEAATIGAPGIAIGNVVGSNIFNILGIAGVTGLMSPISIPGEIIRFDAWIMLASALVLVLFAVTGWRVSRREGTILLVGYAAYLVVQLSPPVRYALGLA